MNITRCRPFPIPEGVMYPDTPLRAQSSHGRRRSKHSEISSYRHLCRDRYHFFRTRVDDGFAIIFL
jgi:hypothetical protein